MFSAFICCQLAEFRPSSRRSRCLCSHNLNLSLGSNTGFYGLYRCRILSFQTPMDVITFVIGPIQYLVGYMSALARSESPQFWLLPCDHHLPSCSPPISLTGRHPRSFFCCLLEKENTTAYSRRHQLTTIFCFFHDITTCQYQLPRGFVAGHHLSVEATITIVEIQYTVGHLSVGR